MNRGIVILTSIIAGFIVGLLAGAYMYTAWIPSDAILSNASPKYLAYDAVNMSPQYRDFYLVRAANKYQSDLKQGVLDPLKSAFDVLGVTSGDTSMDEAISMLRMTEKVATKENNLHGDLGLFTKNEELALGSLTSALESAKIANTYPKVDPSRYAPTIARTNVRIIGFVIWAILACVAGLIVYMVERATRGEATSTTLVMPSATLRRSQVPLEPEASASPPTMRVSQQPPGVITNPGVTAPMQAAGAAPVIPVETADTSLNTFGPTRYRFGDDHYDESFTINGPDSELLGECGASIADRIGVDTPSKVSALSLWVFDKKDFQSTTKVLMTEHAWNDSVIRSKLKARGEAVLAIDAGVVEILTTTLRVEVQVNDLRLNTDNNPPNGYFQNVSLTFTVYRRSPAT